MGRDLIFLINLPFPSLPLGEISLFNIKFACITFFKLSIRISFKKIILHLQILSIKKISLFFLHFFSFSFYRPSEYQFAHDHLLSYRLDLIHSRPDVRHCCCRPRSSAFAPSLATTMFAIK